MPPTQNPYVRSSSKMMKILSRYATHPIPPAGRTPSCLSPTSQVFKPFPILPDGYFIALGDWKVDPSFIAWCPLTEASGQLYERE